MADIDKNVAAALSRRIKTKRRVDPDATSFQEKVHCCLNVAFWSMVTITDDGIKFKASFPLVWSKGALDKISSASCRSASASSNLPTASRQSAKS